MFSVNKEQNQANTVSNLLLNIQINSGQLLYRIRSVISEAFIFLKYIVLTGVCGT